MRRHLVVVRCGPASLHPTWVAGDAPRTFDLWRCPYADAPAADDLPALARTLPGGKWAGLARLLADERAWRAYDHVWLPDDDLGADAATIDRFFAACVARDAALAAPALAEDAQFSHVTTLRNRAFRARATTFVEIMAPCFRRDVLEALLPTFSAGPTGHGWGLDDAWGRLLDYRGLYVMDDVTVRHDRPVGARRTAADDRALRAEMRAMHRRYDARSLRKTLGGVDLAGATLTEASPGFLDALLGGWAWLFEERPYLRERLLYDQHLDAAAWLRSAPVRAARGPLARLWARWRGDPLA